MCISSRNRSQESSSRRAAGFTRPYVISCFLVLSVAVAIGYASQLDGIVSSVSPGVPNSEVKSYLKDLIKAIHDTLGKERQDITPAMQSLQVSFDSLPKDSHGLVSARGARHLLHTFFARHGLKIEGLSHQSTQPSSSQGLHEALVANGIFQHTAPSIHETLRRMANVHAGFSLKTVGGMVAVIKAKHLSKARVSTMMKMLYRSHNLSTTDSVSPQILQNISDQYITYINDVDPFTKSPELALPDSAALAHVKDRAMQHAHALKERAGGFSANSTYFSASIVALVLENLTDGFMEVYQSEHCGAMSNMLTSIAPKETGRLQFSSFYSQSWNSTQNFQEPKRYLQAAGALDTGAETTAHVLIANYMQGPLNCIKQSQPFSICCPNRCIDLMQSVEASIRSSAATPKKLLDAVANVSLPSIGSPSTISQDLSAKLTKISLKHGGMVPLHGRLFAQWMHYAFPNDCAYPQEEKPSSASPQTRLVAKDITAQEREDVAWAKVADSGFGVSAKMLRSSQWSESEELPLQQTQTLQEGASFRQIGVRLAACIAVLGILLHMILSFVRRGCINDKETNVLSAQQFAFQQQVKAKLEALRFEFNVDISCGKHQEHMKVGMQLKPAFDLVGGILVEDILPDGLMHLRNKTAAEGKRKYYVVKAGDRLMSVSGETEASKMVAELSKVSTKKLSMRFSRDCCEAAPLVWTTDVSRNKGEPWGMSISEAADSQNSKELTVSRVLSAGPVDKWNKRAVRKNTYGIYPGDVILACYPELDAKNILSMLQTERSITLTVLRWQAAQASQTDGNATCAKANLAACGVEDSQDVAKTSMQSQAPPSHCADQGFGDPPPGDRATAKKERKQRCSCCGAGIGDKFLVMTCLGGEVNHYRRTCWRHKHGGFTLNHMPRRCPSGKPVAKLEVFERSSPADEARLVHTILDGPMEIDISLDDAAENQEREERPAGSRRAASITRRSIEGDARKRAASAARRSKLDHAQPKEEQQIEIAPEADHRADEFFAESSSGASTSRTTELPACCKTQGNTEESDCARVVQEPVPFMIDFGATASTVAVHKHDESRNLLEAPATAPAAAPAAVIPPLAQAATAPVAAPSAQAALTTAATAAIVAPAASLAGVAPSPAQAAPAAIAAASAQTALPAAVAAASLAQAALPAAAPAVVAAALEASLAPARAAVAQPPVRSAPAAVAAPSAPSAQSALLAAVAAPSSTQAALPAAAQTASAALPEASLAPARAAVAQPPVQAAPPAVAAPSTQTALRTAVAAPSSAQAALPTAAPLAVAAAPEASPAPARAAVAQPAVQAALAQVALPSTQAAPAAAALTAPHATKLSGLIRSRAATGRPLPCDPQTPQGSGSSFSVAAGSLRPPPGLEAPCHEAVGNPAPPPGLPPPYSEGPDWGFWQPMRPLQSHEEFNARGINKAPCELEARVENSERAGMEHTDNRRGRRWGRQHSEAAVAASAANAATSVVTATTSTTEMATTTALNFTRFQ